MTSRDLYRNGIGMVVKNGRSTLFWTNKWVEGIRLKDVALREVPPYIIPLKVSDYWGDGTGFQSVYAFSDATQNSFFHNQRFGRRF